MAVLNSYSRKMFPIRELKCLRYATESVYVRFAVAEIHENSQRGVGVFQALYRLRDAGKLHPYDEEHLRSVSEWFNTHLEKPTRFTAAKPPYYRKESKAISCSEIPRKNILPGSARWSQSLRATASRCVC